MIKKVYPLFAVALVLVLSSGCAEWWEVDPETPTNELMEGVWKVSSVVDETGADVTDTVMSYFPQYLHLDNQNSVNSTLGPLFMYLVYGKSRLATVTSTIDEVFKYLNYTTGSISLTEGEWFITKNEVVDVFTIEIKMRFPTMTTVNTIFDLFNLNPPSIFEDAADLIIYHKFRNVTVEISDDDPDIMVWIFDDQVNPTYNTKDNQGDLVMYDGIGIDAYSRCTITFEKQLKSLTELVSAAADSL